jgi:hypothetical protein
MASLLSHGKLIPVAHQDGPNADAGSPLYSLRRAERSLPAGLLAGMYVGQQASQEPAQLALHVQTDLVVVPFQVQQGSRSVSDLKPC